MLLAIKLLFMHSLQVPLVASHLSLPLSILQWPATYLEAPGLNHHFSALICGDRFQEWVKSG
jgi:hypothetical protein